MEPSNIKFRPVDFDPFASIEPILIHTTEAQKEIWTNIQFGGHAANCSYNESVSIHLSGNFNFQALKQSVDILIQNHDSLRATFTNDGMYMKVHQSVEMDVEFIDYSGLQEDILKEKLSSILNIEAETEFNLETGPLGRIKLIKLNDLKYQLIITFHHIVCDGWSLGIIMQDLSQLYSSIVEGKTTVLPAVESYATYSNAESVFKQSKEFNDVATFWLNQFKDHAVEMQLPINKNRPPLRSYEANRIDIEVDPRVISELRSVGVKNGTSFITTITAAFEVFLSRITSGSDVVVGLAAAGQSATGLDRLVGHCVNLLLLKSHIEEKISFNEYLKMRKPQILDAYDNQRYTYGSLIQKLNIQRSPGHIPLVPVSFNVDLGLTDGVEFSGCSYTFTTNPRHYENFEFFINAAGNGNELTLECTYNTSLFTQEMMQLRMEEFVVLLTSIVKEPHRPVSRLNMITSQEKVNLFETWQGVQKNYFSGKCIHQLIDEIAVTHSESIAVKYKEEQLTYGELKASGDRMAAHLSTIGIKSGDAVVVYMERSPEMIITLLAVLKTGAAYIPVDISYPDDRVKYVIENSGSPILISQKNLSDKITFYKNEIIFKEDVSAIIESAKSLPFEPANNSNDIAYIIYTSGSTGNPKGVAIEHFSLVNYISYCNDYYFSNKEIGNFALYSSLSFDLTVTSIYSTLTRGKTLTIYPRNNEIIDILTDTFSGSADVDCIKMTPAHILLLEALGLKSNKIKKAIVGGEELTPLHVKILRAINHEMEIVNEYEPHEATVVCIIKDVVDEVDSTTIGKPIANMQAFVLDRNDMPLPPGLTGHLYLGGFGLARGYFKKNDLTDEKFRIITVNNEPVRLYDSGDIARYRIDGDLDFLGRSDDQVKIRGYRIELGEIEAVLMKAGLIKNVVLMVREDIPGDKRIAAYIVLNTPSSHDASYFNEYLKSYLPEYMVPSSFTFMEVLPITANGKINRKALPSPDRGIESNNKNFQEPQTSTEQIIANIWCDVLHLDKVGINDNFFELGGHSLLGVKMFNEIDKQLGIKLNLSVLFSTTTIKDLARFILNKGSLKPVSCLVPLQTEGDKIPLFCIHMHNGNVNRWRVLTKHLGSDQPIYAIQPVGLDINAEPHHTIEEMAAYYVNIVRRVQPHGPYNLIGLCFSGMVVYEMAVILQEMGEQVAYLGMINNYAPPENQKLYRIKKGLNKFMKMEMGEKFQYAIDKNINLGKKLLFKAKILKDNGESEIEEVEIDEQSNDEVGHDLRTIHSLALLHYHPVKSFNGNLHIMRTDDPIDEFYNNDLGWDRLVKGTIESSIIEGCDTDTIITDEPYNALLSNSIKSKLDKFSHG